MEFNPSGRSASRIIRRILEEKNPGENPPAFQRERERETILEGLGERRWSKVVDPGQSLMETWEIILVASRFDPAHPSNHLKDLQDLQDLQDRHCHSMLQHIQSSTCHQNPGKESSRIIQNPQESHQESQKESPKNPKQIRIFKESPKNPKKESPKNPKQRNLEESQMESPKNPKQIRIFKESPKNPKKNLQRIPEESRRVP